METECSLCWTWRALRTDVCSSVVVVFRQSYYLVSSSSEKSRHNVIIMVHSPLCPFSPCAPPNLCNAILLDVMHLGDCYRDFRLSLTPCVLSLSLGLQIKTRVTGDSLCSFLWGGSMVFRQSLNVWEHSFVHVSLVLLSVEEEKKHVKEHAWNPGTPRMENLSNEWCEGLVKLLEGVGDNRHYRHVSSQKVSCHLFQRARPFDWREWWH
jgi:hypothetical protein